MTVTSGSLADAAAPRLLPLLVALLAAAPARAESVHAPDEDLGGPPSRYAEVVTALAQLRGAPGPTAVGSSPVALRCVATPGQPKYVGIVQRMEIDAPVEEVDRILADLSHYRDLFPDLVDAHEVPGSRDGNRYRTAWEQRVPVFFLPNTRYELTYLEARGPDGRVAYRYRLARRGELTHSDGAVVLEPAGPGRTRFTEYDFFDARWGLIPESMVWRESVGGAFASDLAVKLRAEHRDWSYARVAAEASRGRRDASGLIDGCVRQRVAADVVLAEWQRL